MRKHLTLILPILTALSISSCGGQQKDKDGFKPRLDPNSEVELTVRGHYENFEALEAEIVSFKTYYPKVEINYEYDKDHKKNLLNTLAGDTPPDIFFTYSSLDFSLYDEYTEDLAQSNLNIDLDCIKDAYIYKDNNGKVPYVPIFTATYGMMVNENLFSQYNLSVPQTYDELINVCKTFENAENIYPMLAHNSMIVYPIFFPHFCASILGNQDKVNALNNNTPEAGENMRDSLEMLYDFISQGYIDFDACASIKDDYNATILRFFEGDVAMMLAKGNTVSGTEKRESQSAAYSANPFKYSFHPVPTTDKGGYMYSTVELCFSVNKKSTKLDMANEFMRFLVSTRELNKMNDKKRMTSPCKDMALDGMFAGFGKLPLERRFAPSQLGLSEWADKQVRKAGSSIIDNRNKPTAVDDAIAGYGS